MIRTSVTITEEALNALQDTLMQTEVGRGRALKIAAVRLRYYLVAVAAISVLSVIAWGLVPEIATQVMLVVAVVFLVLAFPLYKRYALATVKRNQGKAVTAYLEEQRALGTATLTYEFTAEGAQMSSPFATVTLPWSSMLGATMAGPYFFIVRRDYKGLIVDTRALAPAELQELQGMMATAGVPQLS